MTFLVTQYQMLKNIAGAKPGVLMSPLLLLLKLIPRPISKVSLLLHKCHTENYKYKLKVRQAFLNKGTNKSNINVYSFLFFYSQKF